MSLISYKYEKLPLNIFLENHHDIAKQPIFELTPVWLQATANFMLTTNEQVWVHCLFDETDSKQGKLIVAWPLVHQSTSKHQVTIRSLSSFYSAVTAPFIAEVKEPVLADEEIHHHLVILIDLIKKNNVWQQMQLGPFADDLSQVIIAQFKWVKVFAKADNWYCDNIETFQTYYSQRPSQLKNTIKRKQKKLAAVHQYQIKMITAPVDFEQHFADYQRIYQQSWKGEETSFAFISQVCSQAAAEHKLRMGMLFVDGQAVAVQLWFLQNHTASIFKLAYDPDYKAYSIGSILSMSMSEHVIKYDKAKCIEFGMGSEPYKKDWMDKKQVRVSLQIFNELTFMGLLGAVKHIIPSKLKSFLHKK